MIRALAAASTLALLAACGLNGTDGDERDGGQAEASAAAPLDEGLASNDAAHVLNGPDARPEMQLQVVLERLGFGPGVIDGTMNPATVTALEGFQEARGLEVTGELDEATRAALQQWMTIPSTREATIPQDWGSTPYAPVPDDPADQAKLPRLGYASMEERLAERFHTTPEVLRALNPPTAPAAAAGGRVTAQANASPPASAPASSTATPSPAPAFRAGQKIVVPNVGADRIDVAEVADAAWRTTLASLGVGTAQPKAARIVVDRSGGWLKAYDEDDRLVAVFTVTTGSSHDPLPLGEWGINGVAYNPPFAFDPDLFWDVPDSEEEQQLPPGPNGPVGVVWIDLTKEHYGIHGTPEPASIGTAQSHGCVRLTNWDAARLALMVSGSTKVLFQA